MTAGTGIFLIVVGAIIRYALNVEIAGVEEGTLGLILILAGAATLLLSLVLYFASRPSAGPAAEDPADPRHRRY
jgi:hypothetical protein